MFALGILGLVVVAVGYVVLATTPGCGRDNASIRRDVIAAHDATVPDANRAIAALGACDSVACLATPSLQLARSFDDFNARLRPLCIPAPARADTGKLIKANAAVAAQARSLAAVKDQAATTPAVDELARRLLAATDANRMLEDDLSGP